MSDSGEIEPFLGSAIEPIDDVTVLNRGVQFDKPKVIERQDILDDILATYPENPERAAQEINKKISGVWDDDFGISYTSIAASYLPGLEIHGVAEKLALSANYLPGANFEGARLNASVITATSLPGLKARGASMDDIVAPLSSFRNADLTDVSAIDTIFNFGDVTDALPRGSVMASAFMILLSGLDETFLSEVADITAARTIIPKGDTQDDDIEAMRDVLAGRFLDVKAGATTSEFDPVKLLKGIKMANALPDMKRLEGMVLDDVVLAGSRLSRREFTGSIWNNVFARGVVLRGAKAAGLILLNSNLQDSDATQLWVPGMFAADSSFRNTSLYKGNLGGSVLLNVDMENADTEESNMDGLVMIGGTPSEAIRKHPSTKVLNLADLPEEVAKLVSRVGNQAQASRQLPAREPVAAIEAAKDND